MKTEEQISKLVEGDAQTPGALEAITMALVGNNPRTAVSIAYRIRYTGNFDRVANALENLR